MCQVQTVMKKRSRNAERSTVGLVTKRAKQIVLDDDVASKPSSPVDITADLVESDATSDAPADLQAEQEEYERTVVVKSDLSLEVKLMQGAVNDMQVTVNLAAARISELRDLLTQYAESR